MKTKKQGDKTYIWDRLRKQWVRLTPEEEVRQHFIAFLLEEKHYPEGLMANEVCIRLGNVQKRCDTVLYDILLQPRMIIEYKAPAVTISQETLDQIVRYNMCLKVPWLILTNGLTHYCCRINENGEYAFLKDIPDYADGI
ncbi:hypothetical protein AGMMS50262_09430 [Bacteroidia bacterium]|nr:hypothetical protein AGMMS50262_09430 [Bacteroidia bacterium]